MYYYVLLQGNKVQNYKKKKRKKKEKKKKNRPRKVSYKFDEVKAHVKCSANMFLFLFPTFFFKQKQKNFERDIIVKTIYIIWLTPKYKRTKTKQFNSSTQLMNQTKTIKKYYDL